jgi:hypothetical protein
MNPNHSRRMLVGTLTLGAFGALSIRRGAHAAGAGLPHLSEADPAAKTLAYVEDAARAEKLQSPGFISGSRCDNCLQLQGDAGASFRPCPLFPGKLVSAAGWCKSWTPEM